MVTDLGQAAVTGNDATEAEDLRIRRGWSQRISARNGERQRIAQSNRGSAADHARGSDRGRSAQRDRASTDAGNRGARRDARAGDRHANQETRGIGHRNNRAGRGLRGLGGRRSQDRGNRGGGTDADARDGLSNRKAEGVLDDEGAARTGHGREARRLAQRRAQETDGVRLGHARDRGGAQIRLKEVSRVSVGRSAREAGQSIVKLGHLTRRLADRQRGAVLQGDDGARLTEERTHRLVSGRGKGRPAQENEARAIDDAIRGGGSQRARLDDGGAVIAAEARKRHAAVAALDQVAYTGDLTRVSRVGRLVDGDGTATEFDARIGVAREVVDRLGRIIETNRGLAAAGAGVEDDVRGADEGVVLAIREGQRDAVLDDDLPVEVLLLIVDVDDAELAVADVGATGDGAHDGVLRGHREGRARGAVDLGPEGTGVVLDDAERAARADDDTAVTEALDVRDDLTTVDGDLADRRALPHQGQRAGAILDQTPEAAVDAAREKTVAVGVLQDRQRGTRGDVDHGAGTRAGDPHVRRVLSPECLEVPDRLVGGDAQLRRVAAGKVAGAPFDRECGVRYGVRTREARLVAVGTNEVDRGGEAERQSVRVGEDQIAAPDEHVTRESAGVEDRERPRARLVDAASAIDASDGPNDAIVDVDVGNIIGVLADIQNRVHVGPIQAREEVGLRTRVEVVDVVKSEDQRARRVGELVVTQGRAGADDIVSGTLEAQRSRALEDDGGGTFHTGVVTNRVVGDTVIGPLVKVTRHLQGALIDDDQSGEGALRTQVVRHDRRGGRSILEGVVREVIEFTEGVVLQRGATGLQQDGQSREITGVDQGRVIGTQELGRGRRVDELIDRQGRQGPDVEGVDGLQPLLNRSRLREQARRA